ncbi:NAD(P)/FAD-dependent oxidoreductase [Streptomyces sp. NPDC002886]|uniref:NAD(P)/FAD-dependent oxidoreductase n=1 Tax=Streptomyces sp. NPDC002886 TaxID=3364667 RepID=UPI0036A69CC8
MTAAVVLGGGMAGLLAATVLADHVDEVFVIEGDQYPDAPGPRRGLPQGQHNHLFMKGGADALDELLPGTTDLLRAAGAKQRGLPQDILTRGPRDWFERSHTDTWLLLMSRAALDDVVRGQALKNEKLKVLQNTKVIGLVGDARRVTGVRIEKGGREAGQSVTEETLTADFVVDATGRRARTPQWLEELGVPAVPEDLVDAGFAYASRWYEAPEGTPEDFPGVMIQVQPGTGRPGRGVALLPNEGNKWIVTLFGSKGGEPPTDEEGFANYTGDWDHPVVPKLLAGATPLTEIRSYRGMQNRWRHYEKATMPEGYLVIGDANAALNPTYGTGMTVSAKSALELRTELRAGGGLTPGLAKRVQGRIAKIVAFAWQTSAGNDVFFPGVQTSVPVKGEKFQIWLASRISQVAARNQTVCNIAFTVGTFVAPVSRMFSFAYLWPVLRGPRKAALTADQAIAQFPGFGNLLDDTRTEQRVPVSHPQ